VAEPANAGNITGQSTTGIRIPAGMPATVTMLLAHLRRAVLLTPSAGGVARASLTPGYKLPSLRDEDFRARAAEVVRRVAK